MQSLLFLADAAEAVQTKGEVIADGLVGMAVVLVILALLSTVISGLSLFFKEKPKAAPAAAPAADIPPEHAKVVAAAALHTALNDSPILPVIIAAAAQAVCSAPETLNLTPSDSSWSLEGRRAVFASHTLKK